MRGDRFSFLVEQWDEAELHVEEVLAAASNLLVARAAFEAALRLRPNRIILLRQGARVVQRTPPAAASEPGLKPEF